MSEAGTRPRIDQQGEGPGRCSSRARDEHESAELERGERRDPSQVSPRSRGGGGRGGARGAAGSESPAAARSPSGPRRRGSTPGPLPRAPEHREARARSRRIALELGASRSRRFVGSLPGQPHGLPRHLELRSRRTRARAARSASGTRRASRNPWRRYAGAARSTSSTPLTLSTNSSQSMEDIQRMLLMTFRTVALAAPWAWSSRATTSPDEVPWAPSLAVEPVESRRDRGVLVAEPLDELDREGAGQRGVVEIAHDPPDVLSRARRRGPAAGPPAHPPGRARGGRGSPAPTAVADSPPAPCAGGWARPRARRCRAALRAGRRARSARASRARSGCRYGPHRPRPAPYTRGAPARWPAAIFGSER